MTKRPVSISHLVFGMIFLGVTALWVVGVATDAEAPDIAALVPAVLIAAGVLGLVATVVNSRRRQPEYTADAAEYDLNPTSSNHQEQS